MEQRSGADPYLAKLDARAQKKLSHRKLYHALAQARGRHRRHNVRIQFDGASVYARLQPLDKLPGKTNYLLGNDRRKWLTGIPNYGRIRYSSIYPGVDLVYYGNQRQLEFDFVVSPGADPNAIALKFDGRERLKLAGDGTLRLGSRRDQDALLLHRPSIYQLEHGRKRTVQGGFVLLADRRVGVRVGPYDKGKPLIVDPVLAYSTYLGGSAGADSDGIAVDANGNAYVVGATPSTDFPVVNGYQSTGNANYVAFISKFDPTGARLLYSTYLGGTGGDYGYGIALDPTGNVYVTGYSFSTDFPIVNGFQITNNNPTYGNVFVARLDTTQSGAASLLYSTYLGGGGNSTNSAQGYGDLGFGIAVDAYGLAYVTGVTTSDTSVTPFPTTASAYQSSLASANGNAFLTVLDTNQSGSPSLVYSTYLGGDGAGPLIGDIGDSVAVDGFGDAYVAGQTTSDSSGPFPTTSTAYQSSLNSPNGNAFIAEISTTQSGAQSLVYSSYFGGSTTSIVGDWGENITLDATGKAYMTGGADSPDFPITSGAFQTTNSEGGKAFAAKFDLTKSGSQSLVYSTFLGGSNGSTGENGNGIVVDSNGDAYVVGCTSSGDFPTTSDAFQSTLKSSGVNAYLSELNPDGTDLQYSTYLGGSSAFGDVATGVALDSLANPYLAGYTDSSDFPTSNAFQSSLNGGQSGFVTKFALNANPGITASPSPGPNGAGWDNSAVTVTFTCVPGAAPIQSCTAPVTISTEGAGQVVMGTAVDTANNTASTSDTVNLDLTAPTLSISSPANNATVSTPYVIITGALTDSLSGPGAVFCNNAPAALTGTNFSCTVQLSSVSNSVTVIGYDVAGNSSTTTLNVAVSMSAPTSLTVTPASPNMVVGGAQAFTAVDQTGTSRPDATWSVSDTTIASFSSSSPNVLVGNAAGTVTLTATVGSVTGQTTVTVLAGSSLAVGTVLWSAAPPSGYTTQQIVQAVPTANGPDLYAIDTGGSSGTIVQALKSDGELLWQTAPNPDANGFRPGVGDNGGGLIIRAQDPSTNDDALIDLSPQTGVQSWEYVTQNFDTLATDIAVGLDGTVYVVENSNQAGVLDEIHGTTGALVGQIALPATTGSSYNVDCLDDNIEETEPGRYGPPVVAPDGSVYLEVESSQETDSTVCANGTESFIFSYNESLSLLRVLAGSGTQLQELNSYSTTDGTNPSNLPGDVIPDGQGSVLAAWSDNNGSTFVTDPGSAVTQPFPLGLNADNSLVLGDSKTAFGTDGTTVVSFNVSNLQQNWTYSSTSGGYVSFINATPGQTVAINDSQLGVIQLDSSGNPSAPVASLQGAVPFDTSSWQALVNGSIGMIWSPDGANGVQNSLADSDSPAPRGNPEGQGQPPLCSTNRLNCVLAPKGEIYNGTSQNPSPPRDITYGVFSLQGGVLQALYEQPGKYGAIEITWSEAFTPANTDSNASICSPFPCSNRTSPDDYNNGEATDSLAEVHPGLRVSVTQKFAVQRMPVEVFWPRLQSNGAFKWFGAQNQTANTTTSSARVTQTPPLSSPVSCGNQPYTDSIACDTTGP